MLLSELKTGESAVIEKVNGSGAFRKRILEMGFIKGKVVEVILNAPLKDPVDYRIMDYNVSLRRSEAQLIEIIPVNESPEQEDNGIAAIVTYQDTYSIKNDSKQEIKVALVGNPNSGKTTLFNIVSGRHEHVGNYSGVTIESKEGSIKHKGYVINVVDLPGTYSLSAYSPEELYVRHYIIDEKPDLILNVVSASNLERNLYLTTELIDIQKPIVVALNMYDELEKSGDKFDYNTFGILTGVPLIPTNGRIGEGVDNLLNTIIDVYEGKNETTRRVNINYGNSIENIISKLNIRLEKTKNTKLQFPVRFISIKLIDRDKSIDDYVSSLEGGNSILELRDKEVLEIEVLHKESSETILTSARYGFIRGGLKETFKDKEDKSKSINRIDYIVTNKYIGLPLFFIFLWIMFECTFRLGSYPMNWIGEGITWLGNLIKGNMADGMFKDLIIDGVIGGVGSVIIFLPCILILYAFMAFMENTGYMARAAFVMDKLMHKIGLHGKSFIPLIMGFGCNVPAILATRTIESRKNRMTTMLILPFMSCSARLPVFLLFAGIFFPTHAGLVLFCLYLIGIVIAILSALLFNRFIFKGKDMPFIMELPPYRIPTLKSVSIDMWDKSKQYLKKMGGFILIASIIVWFLQYFPLNKGLDKQYETKIEQVIHQSNAGIINVTEKDEQINILNEEKNRIHQEQSFIGRLGKSMEPIMKPLGFDWKMSVSVVAGFSAKEIVLSTLAVLYTGSSDNEEGLKYQLMNATNQDGSPVFTNLTVISFLLFILIYFPCLATIIAIKQESGSWKWSVFSMVYTTGIAWLISFIVYQVGNLF